MGREEAGLSESGILPLMHSSDVGSVKSPSIESHKRAIFRRWEGETEGDGLGVTNFRGFLNLI